MTLTELQNMISQLFDLTSDANFQEDELAIHAVRWYSSFARKTTSATFTITSGTKSYSFPNSTYAYAHPKLIIDDDDTVLREYSIYDPSSNGDYYTLPHETDSFKIVLKSEPDRTRNTTLLYSRTINIPSTGTDVIDVPDRHTYALLFFAEALSQSQRQTEFIWGGLPTNYEAYFLGQTGDQVRRTWTRCQEERKKIEEELSMLDSNFIVNWKSMDSVDTVYMPSYI